MLRQRCCHWLQQQQEMERKPLDAKLGKQRKGQKLLATSEAQHATLLKFNN